MPTITGTYRSEVLNGTNQFDTIRGLQGNDTLHGYDGTDYLHGDQGQDRLLAGEGNDYLYGGIHQDYLDGGAGNDIAYYSDHDARIVADLATDSVQVTEYIGDTSIQYTETIKNIEGIVGSNRGNDNIYGDHQNNTLSGRQGNDYLYGRDGNDGLYGEDGTDYLEGGLGQDILLGGKDLDIFAFKNLSEGVDTILDFSEQESDYIQISQSGFGASSKSQFAYDVGTGALSFDASPHDGINATTFAILSNKPGDFSINRAIQFVA